METYIQQTTDFIVGSALLLSLAVMRLRGQRFLFEKRRCASQPILKFGIEIRSVGPQFTVEMKWEATAGTVPPRPLLPAFVRNASFMTKLNIGCAFLRRPSFLSAPSLLIQSLSPARWARPPPPS